MHFRRAPCTVINLQRRRRQHTTCGKTGGGGGGWIFFIQETAQLRQHPYHIDIDLFYVQTHYAHIPPESSHYG